jgi:hypothetical protein
MSSEERKKNRNDLKEMIKIALTNSESSQRKIQLLLFRKTDYSKLIHEISNNIEELNVKLKEYYKKLTDEEKN